MIRQGNGIYLCNLNGHHLKIVYTGNNICKLYLEDEYKGSAPFDYIKKKLTEFEKRWNTSQVKKYEFKEFISTFDKTI